MANRLKVKAMVMEMHEKNVVLTNLIRDIAENERLGTLSANSSEEEICRVLNDKAQRRKELLAEIEHFLCQHDVARRVGA